jgi:pimeloyl-ACP methyl ester carboxylesterase
MARFVLVAGAWHGAWCWELVIPLLEARNHRAEAAELPGMGGDKTPLAGLDMMAWARAVAHVIELDLEPVILVGHSRGGVVISQVAELPHPAQCLSHRKSHGEWGMQH